MLFIHIATLMVLVRILTQEQFGLMAMIVPITSFVMLFNDMGLSTAVVQREKITHAQVSGLFWINLGISGVLAALFTALAPVLAWFYAEPELLNPTLVLSINFLLSGFALQHQGLLQRQMRFGVLARVNLARTFVSGLAGVTAAAWGAGIWSLVIMPLVSNICYGSLLWWVCRWRPARPARQVGLKKLIVFGGDLTGMRVLHHFSTVIDKVLIGRFIGAVPLTLYDKAYALLLVPIRQIHLPLTTMVVTTLSRLQDDIERFRLYFLKAFSLITLITIPIIVYLIVMADEVVLLVLGQEWSESAHIFRLLGFAGLIQPFYNAFSWLLISLGRTKRLLVWTVWWSLFTILSFVAGLLIGGIQEVALSFTISQYTLLGPGFLFVFVNSPLRVIDLIRESSSALVAGAMIALLLLLFQYLWPDNAGVILQLIVSLALMGTGYLAMLCVVTRSLHPLRELHSLWSDFKS